MSDSDDDDGFFQAMANVGTRASTRKADKTTEERLAILETALAMEDKHRDLQNRLLKLRQDQPTADRVQQAEEQLATTKTTTTTAVNRRQETYNTIHGINEDMEDGLTDCKRAALSDAVETDKSSALGTRRTLRAIPQSTELHRSTNDAINALKEIVKGKELRNHVIGKKFLTLSSRVHNLILFLSTPHTLMTAMKKHRITHLPHNLCKWLFSLACSHSGDITALSKAAFITLEYIWRKTMEPAESPIVALADLEQQLHAWFGLKRNTSNAEETTFDSTLGDENIQSTTSSLRQWLILWGILFRNGLVPGTVKLTKTAKECVIALVQLGLDPLVHATGQGLLKELQQTLQELVHFVSLSIERHEWKDWIHTTSVGILEPLPSLGPGSPDSEDSDDKHAFLCVPLAIRLFPIHDVCGKIPIPITEFKEALSAYALQLCTGIERWNDATLPKMISKDPLTFITLDQLDMDRWRALVTSCVAFFLIDQAGETICMDGPRILATTEVIIQVLLVGMRLFAALDPTDAYGIYGSKDDAGKVSLLLKSVEEQCANLAKQMGRLSSRAHFRRTECCLTNLRAYCRHTKEDASRIARTAVSTQVQSNLNRFWGISDVDSDNEAA